MKLKSLRNRIFYSILACSLVVVTSCVQDELTENNDLIVVNAKNASAKNLALGKTAQQSSTIEGKEADKALDGTISNRNSSTTKTQVRPWWQVRLGAEYEIGDIVIYNRTDSKAANLVNFDVFVYNNAGALVHKAFVKDAPSPKVTINAGGVKGSRVRIKLKDKNILSLNEVQVFEEKNDSTTDDSTDDSTTGISAYNLLGLDGWKLQTPKDENNDKKPDVIWEDASRNSYEGDKVALTELDDPRFFTKNGQWARFICPAIGPSTSGSSFPRSELREMELDGVTQLNWDLRAPELRSMEVTGRVIETPSSGKVVFAQIHALSGVGLEWDDIIRIQVRTKGAAKVGDRGTLYIMGDVVNEINDDVNRDYILGEEFNFKIEAQNSTVRVFYMGKLIRTYTDITCPLNYFKAGSYVQSSPKFGQGVIEFKEIINIRP